MKRTTLKVFCLFCALVMAWTVFLPTEIFVAAAEDYAQITFGSTTGFVNASMPIYGSSIEKVVQKDGRYGRISDKANGDLYFYVNVSDALFKDIPMYTPIDIIVEYYDGQGSFAIDYDSHTPQQYPGVADNAQIWRSSEFVYLTNTNTWKSYTFHFEDMKMANRANGSDFRLGIFDPFMKYSSHDVIFGSITVKRSEFRTPLNVNGVTSVRVGNIFSADDEVVLNPVLENKTENPLKVSCDYKITADNGILIAEGTGEPVELGAKEAKNGAITIENPGIYGLYDLELKLKTIDASQPDRVYEDTAKSGFSVSTILEDGEQDTTFGACQQVVGHSRGTPDEASRLMKEMGMTMVRDEYTWENVEVKKGELVIPDSVKEKWRIMRDNGIEVMLIPSYYNSNYDNGQTPYTEEGIAAFARYCGFMASELKGIVKYFEVWNEYNISAFNKSNASPETYAQMLKASYIAIKEANPEAVVLSTGTAQIVLDWSERVFEAGGYDYLDVVAVHPYDWSGSFREQKLIQDTADLKALMQKYGPLKPIWFTEIGFSSYSKGYTKEMQAAKVVMLKGLCEAYDLCDKLLIYCFYDRQNPADLESCWGFVNKWDDTENTPNGAKPSFLAAAAMTKFTGKNADCKAVLEDNRIYAMDFYNTELNKDVLMLISGTGTGIRNYNLGCQSVTLYDMYGNPMEEIYSDSGIYSFCISEVPYYVMGNFGRFEMSEQTGDATADDVIVEAVSGDDVTFTFTADSNKSLNIQVDEVPQITVKENSGFSNGKAKLTLSLADSAEQVDDFYIRVTDAEGKVYYIQRTRLKVVDPLTISIAAERATQTGDSHWRLRVTAVSNSLNQTVSGNIGVIAPEKAVSKPRSFESLEPGGQVTFLFNLPEQMIKETMNVTVQAVMTGGYIVNAEKQLSFDTCVYTDNKPVIDGVSSLGEWTGSWFGAQQEKDIRTIKDWGGPADLSFSASAMWDEDNFYLLVIVNDDSFSVNHGNIDDPYYMYMGDGIQMGLDDRETINTVETATFTEIGMGHIPSKGDVVFRSKCLYGDRLPLRQVIEGAELAIKRYDTYTLYEAAIPWDGIFYEDYVLNPDGRMGFSMLVNDNDIDSRRGWIEYMSGIGQTKNATLFGNMTFLR